LEVRCVGINSPGGSPRGATACDGGNIVACGDQEGCFRFSCNSDAQSAVVNRQPPSKASTFYCGISVNEIDGDCDNAVPCPSGDECPPGHGCFAFSQCSEPDPPNDGGYYCGASVSEINGNCDNAMPCPTGDECPPGHGCFAFSGCGNGPTPRPSPRPTQKPAPPNALVIVDTAISNPRPTPSAPAPTRGPMTTPRPNPRPSPKPTPGPVVWVDDDGSLSKPPAALWSELTNDEYLYGYLRSSYYCLERWETDEWREEVCDAAVPCPEGRHGDCPEGTK